MNAPIIIAASWIAQEHRVFGLDWTYLDALGFLGQAVFSFRFITQWIASEKKGESVIPVSFWHWSIWGSLICCAYWIMQRKPVGILAYLPNVFIYWRNLHLIKKRRLAPTAAAPSQTPKEEAPR